MPGLVFAIFNLATYLAQIATAKEPINHLDEEYIRLFGPWSSWKTVNLLALHWLAVIDNLAISQEPSLESTILDVTWYNNTPVQRSPGYYFFTLSTFNSGGGEWGPQIFDDEFNLVYMAHHDKGITPQDPHVCDYQGESGTHICAGAAGSRVRGSSKTSKLVFNSSYLQVGQEYGAVGDLDSPDGHENNMLEGGESLLQVVYQPRQFDLSPFGGPENGWVNDGCLQEVSIRTAKELFRWCYLDHLPVWETYIFPATNTVNLTSPIAGKGTEDSRWDFMHVNAADKNFEGDYIISARHLDQIIKIAGINNLHGVKPGTVLWRLGGKHSDFAMNDAMFSRQHHVRYLETTVNETTLSLFDNAWEGKNPPSYNSSAGRIITINNSTMQARLVREYIHPNNETSLAQGSMQVLPDKSTLVGWGFNPQITEYSEDGNVFFHAYLSHSKPIFAYRVYKFPWVGNPLWPPKLLPYSRTCDRNNHSPLIAYVSWNGATEVASYRFHISVHGERGPWISAGTFLRQGFETRVELMTGTLTKYLPLAQYVSVQALNSRNQVLGHTTSRTFVPMNWALKQCNETECFHPPRFSYSPNFNSIDSCGTSPVNTVTALLVYFVVVESTRYIGVCMILRIVNYFAGQYHGGDWQSISVKI